MEEQHNTLKDGFDLRVVDELIRVSSKVNMYFFANKNLLKELLIKFDDKYNFDILVYHKTNPTPMCNNKYLSDLEYILYVREEGVKLTGNYHTKSKLFSMPVNKNEFDHPTVKPSSIIRTLIENSAIPNATICDPYTGSGTTPVVSKEMGYDFLACEINPKHINTAQERLSKIQPSLFFGNVAKIKNR